MQKSNHSLIVIANLALFLVVGLFAANPFPELVKGTSPNYTVSLTAENAASISTDGYKAGSKTIKSVIVDYHAALDLSGYHTQLEATNGSIGNDATTPITSILSFRAVYTSTASMILTTGMSANPTTNSITLANDTETAVSGYPYFFLLKAGAANVNLTSLTITYSCIANTSSSSSSSAWPSEPINEITDLDFYALNDFHGAVAYNPDTTYPEAGITRLATYFDEREAENPGGTVLLAAGDMWQGSADSNLTHGNLVVDCMNAMNFDAMEIGNHEFDWTDTYIYENQQRANFPFLGANIIDKTTGLTADFAEPYTMIERQGVRIGIIGIIGDTLESSILPSAITNYDFVAGASYVIDSAAALRSQGADVVIVLDHNGTIDSSVLPYVDAAFMGHTHSYGNTVTSGVPLMQAYCNGEAVSHVSLSYNKTTDTVTLGTHEVVEGIADLGLSEAVDVKAIYDSYGPVIDPIKNEVVGTLTSAMSTSQFGRFAVQAMLEYGQSIDSQVVASFHNTGGIRASLPSGEVTYGDIYAATPFDNDVIICTVTGTQLIKWLSRSNYTAGASGTKLADGSSIVSTNTYKVIAISYLTENTSSYPHSAEFNTHSFVRDLAKEKFKQLTIVNPYDY